MTAFLLRLRNRHFLIQDTIALAVIAESFDYICPERLTPNLVWMAELLATHDELTVPSDLLAKLEVISISTVQRRLDRSRSGPSLRSHHRGGIHPHLAVGGRSHRLE